MIKIREVQKILFLFIFLFTTSSCSIISPEPDAPENTAQALDDFPQEWSIHGRMSIINGTENWYAKFIWSQKKSDFQIGFMGPLGEIELLLTQKGQITSIKTPSNEHRYESSSDNLEKLLFKETGWKLPINSLRYWSYGMPNPDAVTKIKYDNTGNISDLYQQKWHVQYPKRMQVGKYYLPKKIIVTEQELKIKIIITRWNFQSIVQIKDQEMAL